MGPEILIPVSCRAHGMNLEFEEVCDVELTVETTFVYEVGLFRRRDQRQKISGERPFKEQ